MDFLSFRITSSYIVPFSCTYNGHQKSNCLLISSKLDVVKSLWNRLQSIVPDRIENGEKPCISKDFLVLCFTSRCRIGATPKRKVARSNRAGCATSSRTSLGSRRFFMPKNHLSPVPSLLLSAKGHVRLACSVASALATSRSLYQPFAVLPVFTETAKNNSHRKMAFLFARLRMRTHA